MLSKPLGVVKYALFAVFDPARIVSGSVTEFDRTRWGQFKRAIQLSLFYLVNLVLYAVPLTLAGFGQVGDPGESPAIVESVAAGIGIGPELLWSYVMAFVQNCSYLFLFSILTFVMFHLAVWVTRSSNGYLQSINTVVYSTGIYLAAIFSVTWYITMAESIVVAEEWLIWLQAEFVYTIIDAVGSDLELATGRPEPVSLADATRAGVSTLALLFVSIAYYLYSLYLGAQINHDADRTTALLTVVLVVVSPALFVLGSVLVALYGGVLSFTTI